MHFSLRMISGRVLWIFFAYRRKKKNKWQDPAIAETHKCVLCVNVYAIWQLLTIQIIWFCNDLVASKWHPILTEAMLWKVTFILKIQSSDTFFFTVFEGNLNIKKIKKYSGCQLYNLLLKCAQYLFPHKTLILSLKWLSIT